MGFISFLLIGHIAIFIGHYLLYRTIVKFYEPTRKLKISLAIILTVLSVSFLPAMMLVHWKETMLTKGINYLLGLWMGTFTNIVLLIIAFWIVYIVAKRFTKTFNWKLIANLFFIAALLLSTWGVYSAYHPVVRKLTLSINNLPAAWKDKRIVHISDLHLGLSNNAVFGERVVTMVNEQRPDIIFITGDLFDGGKGQLDEYVPLLKQLNAPLGVYFITGNHETYVGDEEIHTALEKTNIKVLSDEAVEIEGVRIIGVRYPERSFSKDVSKVISGLVNNQQPQLLLYHSPTQLKEFEQAGIDMMFSGHTHRGQLFPFGLITSWVYGGYDRGLNQIGDMQLYVSSGTATWGPAMKTSGRTEITVFALE